MTHTLSQLRKLNAERTQGDWVAGVHPANHKMNIIKPIMMGNRVEKLPEWEGSHAYFKSKADADFIAAMPDAMKLLEKYHEALVSVVAEAKEHWPDAESWQIIEEITALLEESND